MNPTFSSRNCQTGANIGFIITVIVLKKWMLQTCVTSFDLGPVPLMIKTRYRSSPLRSCRLVQSAMWMKLGSLCLANCSIYRRSPKIFAVISSGLRSDDGKKEGGGKVWERTELNGNVIPFPHIRARGSVVAKWLKAVDTITQNNYYHKTFPGDE